MKYFKIAKVDFDFDSNAIHIKSEDGETVQLALTAECCSCSFFEKRSVDELKELVGQTLLSINHVNSAVFNKSEEDEHGDFHDTKYHAVKVTTDQEVVVVDWRNESNGYYDGECVVTGWDKDGV